MLKKNEEYIVEIIDNGFQGEGIAKIDNMVIFIPNAIKGEKTKIKILKVTSKVAYGKIIEILEKSEDRIDCVDCETFSKCGGCVLRHVKYEKTLEIKKEAVEVTLRKALGREIKVSNVLKMDEPYNYRNKLQYPVGMDLNGKPVMGVFAETTHMIIPTKDCKIQDTLSQKIANDIFEFIEKNNIEVYNEKTLKGSLRHIVIRKGKKTNEVMVTLVVNDFKVPNENKLIDFLTNKYSQIKTIIKNLNNKNTNVILGQQNQAIYGDGYISDILLIVSAKLFSCSHLFRYSLYFSVINSICFCFL